MLHQLRKLQLRMLLLLLQPRHSAWTERIRPEIVHSFRQSRMRKPRLSPRPPSLPKKPTLSNARKCSTAPLPMCAPVRELFMSVRKLLMPVCKLNVTVCILFIPMCELIHGVHCSQAAQHAQDLALRAAEDETPPGSTAPSPTRTVVSPDVQFPVATPPRVEDGTAAASFSPDQPDSQVPSTLQVFILESVRIFILETKSVRLHSTSHSKLIEKMVDFCTDNNVSVGREAGCHDMMDWQELAAQSEDLLSTLALSMGCQAPRVPSAKTWYYKCATCIGKMWGDKTEPMFHASALCGACNKPMHYLRPNQSFVHSCANKDCKKPLHSHFSIMCSRKAYMPTENLYYCTKQCAGPLAGQDKPHVCECSQAPFECAHSVMLGRCGSASRGCAPPRQNPIQEGSG